MILLLQFTALLTGLGAVAIAAYIDLPDWACYCCGLVVMVATLAATGVI